MPTTAQLADVLTKILPGPQFQDLLSKLGMVNVPSSLRRGEKLDVVAALLAEHLTASILLLG